jgi:hypothetical protein
VGRLTAGAFLVAVIISALVELASRQVPGAPFLRTVSDVGILFWAAWLVFAQRFFRILYTARIQTNHDLSRRSVWIRRRFWLGAALMLVGLVTRTISPHYRNQFPPLAELFVDGAGVVGLMLVLFTLATLGGTRAPEIDAVSQSQTKRKPHGSLVTFPLIAVSAIVLLGLFNSKWTTHSAVLDSAILGVVGALAMRELVIWWTRPGWQPEELGSTFLYRDTFWPALQDGTLAAALLWLVLGKHVVDISTAGGKLAVVGGAEALLATFVLLNFAATFADSRNVRES